MRPEEALSVFIYCQYFIVHLIHSTFTDFAGIRHIMQSRVAERHFLDLRKTYGSVLAVDLVNTVSIGWLLVYNMQLYFIIVNNNKFSYEMLKEYLLTTYWLCSFKQWVVYTLHMHGICMCVSIGLCFSGSEPSFIHYFKCLIMWHLYLLPAWRWGTLKRKVCKCNAAHS